jgi:peptidoglycan hydrolase-like protein with peptidoglycan-binding domain
MSTIVRVATVAAAALLSVLSVGVANAAAPAGLPTCQGNTPESVAGFVVSEIPSTFQGNGDDNCLMSLGSFGNGVWALQDSLNNCYSGNNLTEDGNFGPLTRQALENAQSAAHITVDGVYGPQSLNHLLWWDPNATACAHFGP